MNTILVTKKEVLGDIPLIYKQWIKILKKLKPDLIESDLQIYYTYGYFQPKVKDKEEYYKQIYEKCSVMLFDERLTYELSKIRTNLTIKSGELILSDRLPKELILKIVTEIVTEITKVKMLVEYEYNQNEKIKSSIPKVDTDIVSFEIIRDLVNNDYSKSQNFDIDFILDKISKEGLESLSDEEREFLDKKSKDV